MSLRVRKNKARPPVIERGPRCPLNSAMTLLGGAWAPHVIYFLSEQPRRFGELRIDIPKISARVLSRRLRDLEAKGVIARTLVPTSPPTAEYSLTALGRELLPALMAIAEVGRRLDDRPVSRRVRASRAS
jgi:DNA-binding HxlR family transcriptional regulator